MSEIRFNRWSHQSGTGGIYQDSSGNIGIGTSTPTSVLDIQGGSIKIGSDLLTSSGVSTFTSGLNVTSGSVGIGTDNPNHVFELRKDSALTGAGQYPAIQISNANASGYSHLTFTSGQGTFETAGIVAYNGDNSLRFRTNGGNERLRITSSGNIGIGSDNPGNKLDVAGDVKILDNSPRLFFYDANATGASNATGGFEVFDKDGNKNVFCGAFAPNADNLIFGVTGQERARIDSSGNIGIGSQTPGVKLDVQMPGSSSRQNLARFRHEGQTDLVIQGQWGDQDIGSANGTLLYNSSQTLALRSGSSGNAHVVLRNSGNIGIGTDDPSARLDVVGGGIACSGWSNNNSGASGGMELGWDGSQVVLQSIDRNGGGGFQPIFLSGSEIKSSANIRFTTSGNGIDFSATSDASGMSSELLDDYEEGTWTPTISSGVTSPTYTNTGGAYTKIGDCVFFTLRIQCNGGTNNGSRIEISGLPFPSSSSAKDEGGAVFGYSHNIGNGVTPTLHISHGASNIKFYHPNGNNWNGNSGIGMVNRALHIHGQYFV